MRPVCAQMDAAPFSLALNRLQASASEYPEANLRERESRAAERREREKERGEEFAPVCEHGAPPVLFGGARVSSQCVSRCHSVCKRECVSNWRSRAAALPDLSREGVAGPPPARADRSPSNMLDQTTRKLKLARG